MAILNFSCDLLFFVVILCVACVCDEFNNSVESVPKIDGSLKIPPDKFFLDKIFKKYGDENVITFEGFEHLLDSLGLGGGVFRAHHELALHRINGTFQAIHDPAHRHRRHVSVEDSSTDIKECMTPLDILSMYGLESQSGAIHIKPNTFLDLCPALVYQLDQRACFHIESMEPEINDKYLAWMYAGLTVLIISATGLLGVAVIPMANSPMFNQILHFLVALAIGTLCGDALLHLLPHALISHSGDESHEDHNLPILKCTLVFSTILLFYAVEATMRIITGNTNSHSHNHQPSNEMHEVSCQDIDEFELHAMMPKAPKKKKKSMAPIELMVILGDGLHNLTDGLAIGAAFSNDPVTGFATALAVFCHELPHELGDFAVLIKSGMSIKKALCYNLLSSVLSFIGTAIGLWLAEDHASASQWIYAATAGTFLYIALANLVPEITENGTGRFVDFVVSFLGIALGGVIMLSIALHEEKFKYLFNY